MRYFLNLLLHQTCEICKFKRDDPFSEVGLPSKEREKKNKEGKDNISRIRVTIPIIDAEPKLIPN